MSNGKTPSPRIEKIEHYHGFPVYRLSYPEATPLGDALRHAELEALRAIPEERFALVVSLENLLPASDLEPNAEAGAPNEPLEGLGSRLIAVTRYGPPSIEVLVTTMLAHVHSRRGVGSEIQPDLPSAVRRLHQILDRTLEPTLTQP